MAGRLMRASPAMMQEAGGAGPKRELALAIDSCPVRPQYDPDFQDRDSRWMTALNLPVIDACGTVVGAGGSVFAT